MVVDFEGELWRWDARRDDTWVFVTLPVEASDDIRELTEGTRRGFGSVRVRVRIGTSLWSTSIFPGGGDGAYVLPVKKAVRRAEGIDTGDTASISLELVDA